MGEFTLPVATYALFGKSDEDRGAAKFDLEDDAENREKFLKLAKMVRGINRQAAADPNNVNIDDFQEMRFVQNGEGDTKSYYYEDDNFRLERDLSAPDDQFEFRIFNKRDNDRPFLELKMNSEDVTPFLEITETSFNDAKGTASSGFESVYSTQNRTRLDQRSVAQSIDEEGAKIISQLKRDPVHNAYFRLLNSLGITSTPGSLGAYFLVGPLDVLSMISSYKKAAWQVFTEEKYIRSRPIRRRQTPLERMGTPGPRDKESVRPQVIYNRMARTNHLLLELTRRGVTGMRRLNGDFLSPPPPAPAPPESRSSIVSYYER